MKIQGPETSRRALLTTCPAQLLISSSQHLPLFVSGPCRVEPEISTSKVRRVRFPTFRHDTFREILTSSVVASEPRSSRRNPFADPKAALRESANRIVRPSSPSRAIRTGIRRSEAPAETVAVAEIAKIKGTSTDSLFVICMSGSSFRPPQSATSTEWLSDSSEPPEPAGVSVRFHFARP